VSLPGNYVCVESGQHGHMVKALRIYKAFTKLLKYERARQGCWTDFDTKTMLDVLDFTTFMILHTDEVNFDISNRGD
jgi:hypothetical protein